ncbi:hypothetical protein ACLOJK_005109 [Asimina triloba]
MDDGRFGAESRKDLHVVILKKKIDNDERRIENNREAGGGSPLHNARVGCLVEENFEGHYLQHGDLSLEEVLQDQEECPNRRFGRSQNPSFWVTLEILFQNAEATKLKLGQIGPKLVVGQDDVDPDNMTYEELQTLGEAIGTESRGLSEELISYLPSSKYKTGFFSRKEKHEEVQMHCYVHDVFCSSTISVVVVAISDFLVLLNKETLMMKRNKSKKKKKNSTAKERSSKEILAAIKAEIVILSSS